MAKAKKVAANIVEAMNTTFADSFQGPSWDRWRAILKGAYALPMSGKELALFREVAEREPPTSVSASFGFLVVVEAARIPSLR